MRLLVCWVLVPVVGLAVVSGFRSMLAARYLAVTLPFGALLIAAVLARSVSPRWGSLFFAVSLACALVHAGHQYRNERPQWPELLRQLTSESRPGDKVIFWGVPDWLRLPFSHYGYWMTLEELVLPSGAVSPNGEIRDADKVAEFLRPHSRVWAICLPKWILREPPAGYRQQIVLTAPGLRAFLLTPSKKRAGPQDQPAIE